MNDFTTLLRRIWKSPRNGDFYIGAYLDKTGKPEYLLNLNNILGYLVNESDAVSLLYSAQRIIIAYVQELHNETNTPIGYNDHIDRSIDLVTAFADVLEESICRDADMIDKYMKRETSPIIEFK